MNIKITILLAGICLFHFRLGAATIYVDSANNSGVYNGTTWLTAYPTLGAAIVSSVSGDRILVAKGTYFPPTPLSGNNADGAFILNGGRRVYGGFPNGGGVRNISLYPTVLDGNIGSSTADYDNSYHVLIIAGLTAAADSVIIDGLTIRNGNASSAGFSLTVNNQTVSKSNGGGIIMVSNDNGGKIKISNCLFTNNSTTFFGGAIYAFNSSPTIENCTFTTNTCSSSAAAIYLSSSAPTISNCTFMNNVSGLNAGALCNSGSSPLIANCTFTGNTAIEGLGGALCNEFQSSPFITHCSFKGNSAAYGGAVANTVCSPIFDNCIFTGNVGLLGAGAIRNYMESPVFVNCTIAGNRSEFTGCGIQNDGSDPAFSNCIVYGNGISIANDPQSTPIVSYCLMEQSSGVYPGTGNVNANPLFVNGISNTSAPSTGGDYDIQSLSPVIDNGTNGAIPAATLTDFGGNARIAGGIVDMGAYEFGSTPLNLILLDFRGDVQTNNTIELQWQTADNSQLDDIELQRSVDGISYKTIYGIKGNKSGVGKYLFIDKQPQTVNFYRLLMHDGPDVSYSNILLLNLAKVKMETKVYPNPTKAGIEIAIDDPTLLNSSVVITNMFGNLICKTIIKNKLQYLSLSNVPPGLYLLSLENGKVFKIEKQ